MIETANKRALIEESADQSDDKQSMTGSAIPHKKIRSLASVGISDKENVAESHPLPRGLYNESNTCYLNSLIQVLFHLLPFRETVFSLTPTSHSQKLGVLEALQWLFLDLLEGTDNDEIVTTNRLTKAFGWTSINRGLQQDIHEFMQTLFNSLEKELSADDFQQLSSLFTGKLERCICCEDVGYKSLKQEEIRGLSLATISFMNIDRSLEDMFKSEQVQMTIENHGKQAAEIKVALTQVPKVLLLTLNRLRYDPVEQAVVKVTDYFEYKDKLELCAHTYRLHSAVVHEGSAVSGHYYCYMSATCNNQWYMLNDDKVSRSSLSCAVRDNYGSKSESRSPTAYLLTYLREDCAEFFTPTETNIPERLRERIHNTRQLEKARLERIQTAHLYTTISLVSWAMLKGHTGYDLCDRLRLDRLHKEGGRTADCISTLRVLKSSTVSELIGQYDPNLNQGNVRLWSFTDRPTTDGWNTHRPDKLIKDWNSTISMVTKLQCPFYLYIEHLDCDLHPTTLDDDSLSVFIKVFTRKRRFQDKSSLELLHHLILSLDGSIDELKSTVFRLSNIDIATADALIYQEQSSMTTERVECSGEMPLCEALGGQLLRHSTIFIIEVIDKQSDIDTGAVLTNNSSQISVSSADAECTSIDVATQDKSLCEEVISQTTAVDVIECPEEVNASDHMRKLGTYVLVTWYNKSRSYSPSQVDGDFTLQLYTDMQMSDVMVRLSEHLGCGSRSVLVYEAKRDQGFPQLQGLSVYDSSSKECLLKLLYKQVQHSTLWRHSAVLYYQQLAMSIEELSVRHTITCTYVTTDQTSHMLTLYPLKCRKDSAEPSTVADLLQLAECEIRLLSDSQSDRPLRLLSLANKRIARVCTSDHFISSLLQDELRLERVLEEEEEAEDEFCEVLASVSIDSAYLSKRNVPSDPFLMVIGRSDSGLHIIEQINKRLKIKEQWMDKVEYRLVIPAEKSYTLHGDRLAVRDWANLAYDDDTGFHCEGCEVVARPTCTTSRTVMATVSNALAIQSFHRST